MKPTLAKPHKIIRDSLLFCGLLLFFIGVVASGFLAGPVRAASSAGNILSEIPDKYCSALSGASRQYYTQCQGAYENGASDVASQSLSYVSSQQQKACTAPIITYPPSQLTACGAYNKGVSDARAALGIPASGVSKSGNGNSPPSNSGGNPPKQSKVPPISDCNQAKSKADQNKCKQIYQNCNQSSSKASEIATCKTSVVNQYKSNSPPAKKSNPSGNPSGNSSTDLNSGDQPGHCNDTNNCDLVALYVNPFVKVLSAIVGLVVAASLIMGGIQYSSSGGDPQKASAAKSRISNTLLALVAYAFLYAFLNFLVPGGIH